MPVQPPLAPCPQPPRRPVGRGRTGARLARLGAAAVLISALLLPATDLRAQALPPAAAASAAPGSTVAPDAMLGMLMERGLLPQPRAADQDGWQGAAGRVSDWASELVLSSMNFLGVRYRRGGSSAESGFDCSGFTRHVFESTLGLVLPRRSAEQARAPGWLKVDRDELKPGDLVFFNTLRSTFSHVGIYVGDGKFIHSPRSGEKVRIEDMRIAYWAKRYNGARRAPVQAPGPTAGALGEAPAAPRR